MPRIALSLAAGDPNGIGPEIVLKALDALRNEPTGCGSRSSARRPCWSALPPRNGPAALLPTLARASRRRAAVALPRWGEVNAAAGASAPSRPPPPPAGLPRGEFDAVVAGPHHETAIARPASLQRLSVAGGARVRPARGQRVPAAGGRRPAHRARHAARERGHRARPHHAGAGGRGHAGRRARLPHAGRHAPEHRLFGINPHASEGTLFGPEDERCVVPAARQLRAQGLDITGPEGADVLLASRSHDLYVAMLHDQGHIPVKLLAPQAASAI
jgi:1,2-dihydroxy-3,5-cyclohexadiene-1,4-dicarboxylate dehydrogenase